MIPERDIIKALADHKLHVSHSAQAIYILRNSMVYRIRAIRKKTGLDPTDFWDMQKLVKEYDITEGEK